MAKKKSAFQLRVGSKQIEVYNEGLFIFLYDKANSKWLKENEAADVVAGGDDVVDGVKRRRELGKSGAIAAFELFQDDSQMIEVSVGAPLSAAECKKLPFLKARRAHLKLPSGKLQIESWNSLKIHDEGGGETGGKVTVPAGDYLMTLYQVDPAAQQHPITCLITLTPTSELPIPKVVDSFIALPSEKPKTKTTKSKSDSSKPQGKSNEPMASSTSKSWSGMIRKHGDSWATDLSPDQIDKLGWRHGARLRLQVGSWKSEAVFLGCTTLYYAQLWLGMKTCATWGKMVRFHSHPVPGDKPGSWNLGFTAFEEKDTIPAEDTPEEILISEIQPRLSPAPDDSLVGKSEIKDGNLCGFVVAASPEMVVLSFPWKPLSKWGQESDEPLLIELGGQERLCYNRRGSSIEEVKTTFLESIPEFISLNEKLRKASDAYEDADWGSPQEEKLKREVQSIKQQIAEIKVPGKLQGSIPLSIEELPHCDRRGVTVLTIQPTIGEQHFINVQCGAAVTVKRRA
ncbi:MAG: hypothetical protein U0930_06240 [Pirellulales bacterium]